MHRDMTTTHTWTAICTAWLVVMVVAQLGRVTAGVVPIPVWVWHDYENNVHYKTGMPAYMRLCKQALLKHAPAPRFDVKFVDKSNIKSMVPDMPPEFDRLPYAAATSDLIRTALLAHHGGVYMDTDFLLTGPLDTFVDLLRDADFAAYEAVGQKCGEGSFSSNFIAGRKGNPLSVTAWDSIKKQLKQKCLHKDGDPEQGVCCYTADGTPRECHIPWAGIGEGTSHPLAMTLLKDKLLKVGCMDEAHGFVPTVENSVGPGEEGHVTPWSAQWVKVAGCDPAPCPCRRVKDDLRCVIVRNDSTVTTANATNYFARLAYHLFASTLTVAEKDLTESQLLDGHWAVSDLYRRALRDTATVPSDHATTHRPMSAMDTSDRKKKVGRREPFRRPPSDGNGHVAGDEVVVGQVRPGRPDRVKRGVKGPPVPPVVTPVAQWVVAVAGSWVVLWGFLRANARYKRYFFVRS
eukprot:m.33634 g.33634  ORF g.33634 m.33634 type:complete len:462 (-) comp5037_c0_seq1:114-1499(-)